MCGRALYALNRRLQNLRGKEVSHRLSATDEGGLVAFDEDLGGAGAGVVVGGLGHAVGSGVEQGDEVAGLDLGDGAVTGEEVSGLADGADDVGRDLGGFADGLADGDDLVVGVVEGGPDEVVHGGVGDDEGFAAVLFDDKDAGEEGSGLGDEEAAGLEEEAGLLADETFVESGGVELDLVGGVEGSVGVVDAEAAAGVDGADRVAVAAELGDERGDAGESGGEGSDLADLGADVDGDSVGLEPLGSCGAAVEASGGFDVDAELVFREAGGDVGVGLGEDVGVDAEGEAGAAVEGLGALGEEIELLLGLDVELEDVGLKGVVDLPRLLAYAGEDDFFEGGLVGAADALELAAGDDVEAGALAAEEAKDGKRGVGLDGVADGVGAVLKCLLEELEALGDLGG